MNSSRSTLNCTGAKTKTAAMRKKISRCTIKLPIADVLSDLTSGEPFGLHRSKFIRVNIDLLYQTFPIASDW